MDKVDEYLRIPETYALALGGLRWSADGEAIEFADGTTFAFAGEIVSFLEGFALQQPFPPFGLVLHLLYFLRHDRSADAGDRLPALRRAFRQAGQVHRNAGVFCAVLCAEAPAALESPSSWQIWRRVILRSFSTTPEFLARRNPGEEPSLSPEEFHRLVARAIEPYDHDEMVHWFKHGRGPVKEPAEQIAEAIDVERPRSLQGALAELARQERLSGAVPFVAQLVSALTLPPRRLDQHDLPLGGYSDVTTRGQPEQILPAQFALDDLEFVRRHAERELLYYRREEPHAQTREELALLLDQGVRTWGTVRLVLAAALFAFGHLADRRRLPLRLATTSGGGVPHDPVEMAAAALAELVQVSDLSPHPALALERLLEDEAAGSRDVVLLTHPFNLTEPDVAAAARRLRPGSRLFAVTVDRHGQVQVSEFRRGAALGLNRFHVELEAAAAPAVKPADRLTPWTGDVEPVGYPFRFGLDTELSGVMHFDFDHAGEWLLVAVAGGIVLASRTDGSASEGIPRGMKDGEVLQPVDVIGVAGGFVVLGWVGGGLCATHYDFARRHCTAHVVLTELDKTPKKYRDHCLFYFRPLHAIVVRTNTMLTAIDLGSGQRVTTQERFDTASRAGRALLLARDRSVKPPFLHVGSQPPRKVEDGYAAVDPGSGEVTVAAPNQAPGRFTPQADGQPALRGYYVRCAQVSHNTLALAVAPVSMEQHFTLRLCLYQLPGGTALAEYAQERQHAEFMLSTYGRQLARQIGPVQVEITPCGNTDRRTIQTRVGGFHNYVQGRLGDGWLLLQTDSHTHLLHWRHGRLVHSQNAKGHHGTLFQGEPFDAGRHVKVLTTRSNCLPPVVAFDPERFVRGTRRLNDLDLVVDRFGQAFLFNSQGDLVCAFFVFRERMAVWLPDGTCFGPEELLGRRATPEAERLIGERLLQASRAGEGATS